MKKTNQKILFLLLASLIVISSACNKYKYWPVSKFRFDEKILTDGDNIKIFYSSRCPDDKKDAYIHIMAVSQKTKDTVNILTTIDNGFKEGDGDKIYSFASENSQVAKILQMNSEQLKNMGADPDKLKSAKMVSYDKVYRDPEFDFLADNSFPTIIGYIGEDVPKDSTANPN